MALACWSKRTYGGPIMGRRRRSRNGFGEPLFVSRYLVAMGVVGILTRLPSQEFVVPSHRESRGLQKLASEATSGAPNEAVTSVEAPEFVYYGVNTFSLAIGGRRILVDPLLEGDLTFFGQRWAFAGAKRQTAAAVQLNPADVYNDFDVVVLTQGLEDHAHLPTLSRIDRRMQIIASPRAAEVVRGLGFASITSLPPGQSLSLGAHMRVTAIPGSVVGPPWDAPENGYVFADTRAGGLAFGVEPHGNFLGPALGTSLRVLPKPPPVNVDVLLAPLTSQLIGGYRLVNGAREAIQTLEALPAVPKIVLPLNNGDIDASGPLAAALQEEGSAVEFKKLLEQRQSLRHVRVLDVRPGIAVRLE